MTLRLFRADTPTDVVAASLVAAGLPAGRDLLLLSLDKTFGSGHGYLDALHAMASAHDWSAVVDISGMALATDTISLLRPPTRLQGIRRTRSSAALLLTTVGDALGTAPDNEATTAAVDEVYLTCLHHPDVRLLALLFPRSRAYYYPHSFDSLNAAEISQYDPFVRHGRPRPAARVRDALTAALFGRLAKYPAQVDLHGAYSFHGAAPWASTHSLRACLSRSEMLRLFERLPPTTREPLASLARRAPGRSAALLLTPDDHPPGHSVATEVEGHVQLLHRLLEAGDVEHVLLKPHPRSGDSWTAQLVDGLRAAVPGLSMSVIDQERHLPVEVVLAPFDLVAVGGLSSALRSLHLIYGVPAYFPETLFRELWGFSTAQVRLIDAWMAEVGGNWIRV